MLKIGLVICLLIVELVIYYLFGSLASFLVQIITVCFLFYWYNSERKSSFNCTDKLLVASTIISLFSPLAAYIPDFFVSTATRFTVIIMSYLLIIRMFKIEGAK